MKVRFSPARYQHRVEYDLQPDVVTVTHTRLVPDPTPEEDGGTGELVDGEQVVETFDFSSLPDGKAERIEAESLPVAPVPHAERVDGELRLTLRHYYRRGEEPERPDEEVT